MKFKGELSTNTSSFHYTKLNKVSAGCRELSVSVNDHLPAVALFMEISQYEMFSVSTNVGR